MREGVAPLSELSLDGDASGFTSWMATTQLSSALLLEARTSGYRTRRPPLLVARSGIDHYLVAVQLCGETRLWGSARELVLAPGDIGVVDLTHPSATMVVPPPRSPVACHITLIVPRARLAPLLSSPDAMGYQRIRGNQPYARLVRGVLVDLWRRVRELTVAQTEPAIQAVLTLVAGGLGPAAGEALRVASAVDGTKLAAIKRYLDRGSGDELDIGALCHRFGISRASLYRMFEPHGGLVNYVRERRLRHALAVLVSAEHRHRRIIDIALEHGFATESGFTRAFRRSFGATPGEARAEPGVVLASHHGAASSATSQRAMSWFLALSSPA